MYSLIFLKVGQVHCFTMNASHMTKMCCEVNLKNSALFQVCGFDVELGIGIIDNWKVDCSDSRVTDHTIDM